MGATHGATIPSRPGFRCTPVAGMARSYGRNNPHRAMPL